MPATPVRSASATCDTRRPSSAALARSTWIASSGRPCSVAVSASATPAVVFITAIARSETRRASSRSCPRISRASRASSPDPLRIRRVIIRLPPEARARTTTPGRSFSERRSAIAISSLVRPRSVFSSNVTVIDPRWLDPPPKGPRPPPTCVVTLTASGTSVRMRSSSSSITSRVRSKRVPIGSSA